MTPKRGAPKIFEFQNFETFKILGLFKILWRGASVDVGFYCIIVYFGGKMAEKNSARSVQSDSRKASDA